MLAPIRVLHVLGNTQLGGAESRIMDLYRHMDRSRIQFDFLVHTDQKGHFDEEIEKLGGQIYRIPRFRLYNYFSYKRAVKKFFALHHDFKAVQGHITSTAAIYLPIAKRSGVPVTIAHARSAGVDKGAKGKLTRWMRRNLSRKADFLFTCSRLAGISVFGEQAVREGRTIFIPNAIDCPAFAYNEKKREEMRERLRIIDQYVIGHVGRFHYAKNHEYLLQVFAALCNGDKINHDLINDKKTHDTKSEEGENRDYILLLLGEGSGMEEAKQLAEKLGIADKVRFLGNQNPVYDYYQAMDYFVYPSRYEGLPGTIVEAQASGLRCLMSDTICEEVAVTELVRMMSIEEDAAHWAEQIRNTADYVRRSYAKEMQEAGFDVSAQTEKMTVFYETGEWK
ncbi:MAG: glycosyltransferase family 1 protein [Lachnospiraceae bacterium]|nr:glycosyltransferase family 1 protein [Lachnospiraceae bacterium]